MSARIGSGAGSFGNAPLLRSGEPDTGPWKWTRRVVLRTSRCWLALALLLAAVAAAPQVPLRAHPE